MAKNEPYTPIIMVASYPDNETALEALMWHFDRGIGCAYDTTGMDKEDVDWMYKHAGLAIKERVQKTPRREAVVGYYE